MIFFIKTESNFMKIYFNFNVNGHKKKAFMEHDKTQSKSS